MRLPYDLKRIDARYLDSLVGEAEGYVLDFKLSVDLKLDQNKFEVAADVTSFANESGGDIFIGVDEEAGIASAVVGIDEGSADALDLQLAQSLHSKTEPRVLFRTHPVKIGNGRVVLVVRVPRSGATPHAVRNGDNLRFFGRNRTGKYLLNVAQIRERFLAAGNLEERLHAFVHARWAVEDDATGGMFSGAEAARFFLHVVPYGALLGEGSVDVETVYSDAQAAAPFFPTEGTYMERRMNADGVQFSRGRRGATWSVTSQMFADGKVERVSRDVGNSTNSENRLLSDEMIAREAGGFTRRAVQGLAQQGLDGPYFVIGSLAHVRGFHLWSAKGPMRDESFPIDRERLLLPTCVLERPPVDALETFVALRPLIAGLLHAGGLTTEGWYNADGKFVQRFDRS